MATLYQQAFLSQNSSLTGRLSYFTNVLIATCNVWPFSWRKLALTVTRVQQDPALNNKLNSMVDDIYASDDPSQVFDKRSNQFFSLEDFVHALSAIYSSPILCGLISFFTRAELLATKDVKTQIKKSILKELHAALHEDRPQQLDYTALSDRTARTLFEEYIPALDTGETLHAFRTGCDRLKHIFEVQKHVFIPHYNSKKNVSYETALNYVDLKACGMGSGVPDFNNITQKTLICFYHESGIQVQGPMEMRFAWRYNDLKGRVYYATGGTSLWRGLFMKSIVKDFLNILPSSHVKTRYDPTRITATTTLQDGELIITYDYSSFTTSLAELKFFLCYLARIFKGTKMKVLDVHNGILEVDLGDYIQEYNETINMNAEFDVSRLDILECCIILHQVRSGMLGAQGNIGFSTLLHAILISGISDYPGLVSCVGDDALVRFWENYFDTVIARVNTLGTIERPKFSIWELQSYYDETSVLSSEAQGWQYLKRPLTVGMDGTVKTGFLPVFPNFAEVLMPPDNYHSASRLHLKDRVVSFIKQYTRFLNQIEIQQEYSKVEWSLDEIAAVLQPIRAVYDRFFIPFEGAPAGEEIIVERKKIVLPVICPPCTIEVLDRDWIGTFLSYHNGRRMEVPVLVASSVAAPLNVEMGDSWVSTSHRIQRVMVDLGYFESKLEKTSVLLSLVNRHEIEILYDGSYRMLHNFLCIKTPPDWYDQVIADDHL